MTAVVPVQLIVADLALIKGVILTLAQISGDDAAALNDVLVALQPVLSANGITSVDPALRDSAIGKAAIAMEFSLASAMLIRGSLFTKVKAFTAADIPQVLRIRAAFDAAFAIAAETKAEPT